MTQQEFADSFGVSRSTVTSWETAKRAIPAPSTKRVADFFGVGYKDFCFSDMESLDIAPIDEITPEEKKQILKFRQLSEKSKDVFRAALDKAYQLEKED